MARYFFHFTNGNTSDIDQTGADLIDSTAAWERALDLVAGELAGYKSAPYQYDPRELHIHDAMGKRVAKIAFRYVSYDMGSLIVESAERGISYKR